MSTTVAPSETTGGTATAARLTLLAATLGATAVVVGAGGLLWPEPAGGGDTYAFADVAPIRDRWWGLLGGLAVVGVVNVTLQALATMLLVRERGSTWATAGAVLMWVGIASQAVGVAGWASAYYYPTDPGLEPGLGEAVVEAANQDPGHLFAFLVPGALLVVLGTVLQSMGLLRARTVPRWVPVALLMTVLTLVVPGSGALGLVTSVPMAAGAVGLAVHLWPGERVSRGRRTRAGDRRSAR
ncbi:hypothetical protein G7072_14315 [Nocardioides sp. HDW12B]|uniref:hypothetical protein n=1 Tax=Nocardioides sp. HDW12B TaxID=2714939 RepID=UPI00140BF123|nr:hypothetical protein [Nocardioides sp. HDW12B]QIK67363.1 hypothetical protein G7072_14315 [Nocardioides sp. HDW12B]